ncbi:MAG: radical SAM protein [Nitrospirae bacterium]|nr:radical SAM protein [Nitrospirota bacterium]
MGLLYTKLKVFHFKEKLDSLPKETGRTLPPLHVRLKPTNVCNHNCRYCAYRSDNLQLGKDMVKSDFIPEEKMMEILSDFEAMGIQAVTLSGGGEPLYYPYIIKTIRRLSSTKIKFATLTNGARLTGEIAELFAHHGTWLRISMDGWDDESYTMYRGVKAGEFTNIMKNIGDFKKLNGSCYLGISLIVDERNAGHISDMIRNLKNAGADSVKISPCIISNDSEENNSYHKPFFEKVKGAVAMAIEELSGDNYEIFDSYHELDSKFKKNYTWCPYLQILCVIGADSNVYSCQDKAYNLDEGLLGSLKDMSFKEFWSANRDCFYKINPSVHCNHHCVANDKNKMVLEYLDADKGHLGFV